MVQCGLGLGGVYRGAGWSSVGLGCALLVTQTKETSSNKESHYYIQLTVSGQSRDQLTNPHWTTCLSI